MPQGIQHAEEHGWKAPMPDYALPGQENAQLPALSRSYILAGAIGVMVIGFLILLLVRLFARKEDDGCPSPVDARPSHGLIVTSTLTADASAPAE